MRRGRSSDVAVEVAKDSDDRKNPPLRVWVCHKQHEAFVVQPPPTDLAPVARYGAGRSTRPLRRDIVDGLLPIVEWDQGVVGQRACVLVGPHEWADALIASFSVTSKSHSIRLADGRAFDLPLPDHRVVLQLELARDPDVEQRADEMDAQRAEAEAKPPPANDDAAVVKAEPPPLANDAAAEAEVKPPPAEDDVAMTDAEPPPAIDAATAAEAQPPPVNEAVAEAEAKPPQPDADEAVSTAEAPPAAEEPPTAAMEAAKASSDLTADAESSGAASGEPPGVQGPGVQEPPAAAVEPSTPSLIIRLPAQPPPEAAPNSLIIRLPAQPPPRPYLSSLSSTGYRYVRACSELDVRTGHAFECAIYIEGKEKNFGPFPTAAIAAHDYAGFVISHPIPLAAPPASKSSKAKGGSGGYGGGAYDAESAGAAKPKKKPEMEYDVAIVGRRVRALFDSCGEWFDGSIIDYGEPHPPRPRPRPKAILTT